MNILPIILIDGVTFASWLFLVSAGITFIFGVLRILNVAHGSLYAIGAYVGATFIIEFTGREQHSWITLPLLLLAAVAVGLTLGPLIERLFLRRVYDKDEVIGLLTTFALFLILEDVIQLIWGIEPYLVAGPFRLLGRVRIAGIAFAVYPFLLTLIAILAGLLLWFIIHHTSFGRQVTCVITDREMAGALGINVPRIDLMAFALGTTLAALGGAFTAPMTSVEPGMGLSVIVLAFAVVGIGGLGSIGGAALGCTIVGIARAAAIQLFPEIELFVIYALMVAVLLWRPQGLFGTIELRKL
ncbi:MAG: branched-chain amino acid ABC transporter permease [Rhodoplanes sp.]|jgi:branched-chain amino acid transport system permease protein